MLTSVPTLPPGRTPCQPVSGVAASLRIFTSAPSSTTPPFTLASFAACAAAFFLDCCRLSCFVCRSASLRAALYCVVSLRGGVGSSMFRCFLSRATSSSRRFAHSAATATTSLS